MQSIASSYRLHSPPFALLLSPIAPAFGPRPPSPSVTKMVAAQAPVFVPDLWFPTPRPQNAYFHGYLFPPTCASVARFYMTTRGSLTRPAFPSGQSPSISIPPRTQDPTSNMRRAKKRPIAAVASSKFELNSCKQRDSQFSNSNKTTFSKNTLPLGRPASLDGTGCLPLSTQFPSLPGSPRPLPRIKSLQRHPMPNLG